PKAPDRLTPAPDTTDAVILSGGGRGFRPKDSRIAGPSTPAPEATDAVKLRAAGEALPHGEPGRGAVFRAVSWWSA
ncbi:hypothetical protein ACWD00_07950, partial [Streptomyces viridiviolaceus]